MRSVLARIMVLTASMLASASSPAASTQPAPRVLDQLTPENSVVVLIDFQPQYTFSTRSTDIDSLVNNAVGLAKAARAFKVPVVATTITAQTFAGPLLQPVRDAIDSDPIDRTVINAWHDDRVARVVRATGRKKLVMAGLWTDNCVMLPALSALAEGFEVYVVTDASGDYDVESHERAIQRLVQAGAVPITWLPVMLEWQSDWSHGETSGAVNQIIREHAASMSAGAQYRHALGSANPRSQ